MHHSSIYIYFSCDLENILKILVMAVPRWCLTMRAGRARRSDHKRMLLPLYEILGCCCSVHNHLGARMMIRCCDVVVCDVVGVVNVVGVMI